MSIAKRLIILLAVPLLAIVGLGVFTRVELSSVEKRSRFVAEREPSDDIAVIAVRRRA